jgi:hypothetical protein
VLGVWRFDTVRDKSFDSGQGRGGPESKVANLSVEKLAQLEQISLPHAPKTAVVMRRWGEAMSTFLDNSQFPEDQEKRTRSLGLAFYLC